MGWSDRLSRWATGDLARRTWQPLLAAAAGATAQQARLAAAAAAAPTSGAHVALQALVSGAGQRAAALAAAARERGGTEAAAAPRAEPPESARNHWARLVAALEADRAERAELQWELPALLEHDATLAEPLEKALQSLDAELLELRTLIARADPQAID
jgi:hypothetical protein